jgi:23S rRNA pseudouridine2605 synthase
MCAAVGLFVVRLRRIRYGNLTLGGLQPGEYRLLSKEEAQALDAPPPVKQQEQRMPAPAKAPRTPQPPTPTKRPPRRKIIGQ